MCVRAIEFITCMRACLRACVPKSLCFSVSTCVSIVSMYLYVLVYAFVDIVRSARHRHTSETHTLGTQTLATYTHAALAVAICIDCSARHRYTLDKRDIDTHTTHIHLAYTQCLRIHTHQGPCGRWMCCSARRRYTPDNRGTDTGWLRSVRSIKLYVSFAEYRLFCESLLQKRPVFLVDPTNQNHPIYV